MTQPAVFVGGFPKSARLLKRRDFQFEKYGLFQGKDLRFIYTFEGQTRVGISISKKVLRNAAQRNRIRRLIKEVFRNKIRLLDGIDIHVVGCASLRETWGNLGLADVEKEFEALEKVLSARSKRVNHGKVGR